MADRFGEAGVHDPDESVVTSLALDVAIDARLHGGRRPLGPGCVDELMDLAGGVASLPVDWWDDELCSGAQRQGSGPGMVPPLRSVSLDRPDPADLASSATSGPGARRRRRDALAAAAAAAVVVALVELGSGGAGGHHPPADALAVPTAARLAIVDDRVQLAPTGTPSTGLSELSALSCPTLDRCVAVADTPGTAAIATSNDGGRTWVRRAAPAGVTNLTAVTCTTPERCLAVGGAGRRGAIAATTDGGTSWVLRSAPRGVDSLDAISCPTAAICWSVGTTDRRSAITATTDGGGTWVSQSAPSGTASLDAVSCPTAAVCWAGGAGTEGADLVSTHDGGRTWLHDQLPPGSAPLDRLAAVSCPSVAACWAVGAGAGRSVVALTGGAAPWVSAGAAGGATVAGTRWSPLCPSGCGGSAAGGPPPAEKAVEGSAVGAVSGRLADGALTCPTRVQCWAVGTGASGFSADAVNLA